jgi:predicted phosphodiesterase
VKVLSRTKKSIRLEKGVQAKLLSSKPLSKGIIIPDTHAPYHNKNSWALITQVVQDWKPEIVVDLGDHFDCYAVSQHRKDPDRRDDIQEEKARAMLHIFDNCAHKYFVEGNHEWRLPRYLMDFAPAIYRLFVQRTKDDLFGLKEDGWHVTPYMQALTLGKLQVTHDLDKAGENAVHDAMSSFMDNVIIGHTHLMRYVVKGTAFGVPHLGASFGWLGDVEKIDYRHSVKARRDYVQGFGTFRLDVETGYSYVTPVPIFGNSCCVEGKVYSL